MVERLEGGGRLKATMLKAHLDWAGKRTENVREQVLGRLSEEDRIYLGKALLATEWIPFGAAVRIDRAIAEVVGGQIDEVNRLMGQHSARVNLGGVYKVFVKDEPHRFFRRMTVLHKRFQSFGEPAYEQTGPNSGRMCVEDCAEYSKVYCRSALGYYEGALEMMKVPGPISVEEVSCQCAGDPRCVFEMSW